MTMFCRRLTLLIQVLLAATAFAAPVTVIPPPTIASYVMKVSDKGVKVSATTTSRGYRIVVSGKTWNDPGWREVVRGLAVKHTAEALVYKEDVKDVIPALAERIPGYVCFVAQPEEAGRKYVVDVHRLTRKLDSDPYTDVIWGILTGYDATSAARIVATTEPLVVRKGAGGTPIPLEVFDEGVWYDEGRKNHMVEKKPGGVPVDKECPDDTTQALVDVFNIYKPDLFVTSGHATERDWQIGYSFPNGQFRCRDGVLYGVDRQKKWIPINSPNPKVNIAVGNCLVGHIPDTQAMALAYMGSGGVTQMVGYTVETWFGYGGWGVNNYFLDQPGRYSLAEAFYLNNQALVHQLQSRFPDKADFEFNEWGHANRALDALVQQLNVDGNDEKNRDLIGLLWDRDTVAFYGDPAWDARLARPSSPNRADLLRSLSWSQTLDVKGDVYTVTFRAMRDADTGRPPAVFLPKRVKNIKVLEGTEWKPVITDNFLLLTGVAKFEKGKAYTIRFSAERMDTPSPVRTSKSQPVSVRAVGKPVPEESLPEVARALSKAGPNRSQLQSALRSAPKAHRQAVAFLIANMPDRHLRALHGGLLTGNAALAYQARREVPWGAKLPEGIFLEYVLPYFNLSERVEDWRTELHERFIASARRFDTPGKAAVQLNKTIFDELGVHYHPTKRPKPDQSPSESVKAGYASCTGLSILLVDACRAVGIPARVVGTPKWTDGTGNHTWVEVWDNGWHFIGASEAGELDQTWFRDAARKADPKRPENRIYAASFKRTKIHFPMVWAPERKDIFAADVTARYNALKGGG